MKSNETVRSLTETAVFVALGLALKFLSDIIPFLNFFEGGTIDLAMLPICLIGLRRGPKYGFLGATLYWLLAWLIGGLKIYSDYPLIEILLDRFIPYTVGYGIASLFTNTLNKRIKGSLVLVLCGIIRLISHTTSGVLLWYSWTGFNEFAESFYASLIYNGSYVLLTTLLAIILFISMNRILSFGLKKSEE
ncbi:energy-coupled thiamine transporter ThiT [bacterium]|nr:energy-coupled thiamine transporter ThiT [bacterium]